MALNLAWTMAHECGLRVALVDFDLTFGSIALALDIEQGRGFRDALESPGRIDGLFIERAMVRVGQGLFVLAAEESFDAHHTWDEGAVARLLRRLKGDFDALVVDLPRAMGQAMPVIGETDTLVVVSDLTLAGARESLRLLELAAGVAPGARVRIAINRVRGGARLELELRQFERVLGRKVDARLPFDPKAAAQSANAGKTIVETSRRGRLGRALGELGGALAGTGGSQGCAGLGPIPRQGRLMFGRRDSAIADAARKDSACRRAGAAVTSLAALKRTPTRSRAGGRSAVVAIDSAVASALDATRALIDERLTTGDAAGRSRGELARRLGELLDEALVGMGRALDTKARRDAITVLLNELLDRVGGEAGPGPAAALVSTDTVAASRDSVEVAKRKVQPILMTADLSCQGRHTCARGPRRPDRGRGGRDSGRGAHAAQRARAARPDHDAVERHARPGAVGTVARR